MPIYKIIFGATSDLAGSILQNIDNKNQYFILHAKNKALLEKLNQSLLSKDNNILLDCNLTKLDNNKWQEWSELFTNNNIKIDTWYWCVGLQKQLTPLMHYQMHTFFEEIHVNLIAATALFKLCLAFLQDNATIIFIHKAKAQALCSGHSIAAGGLRELSNIIKLEHPKLKVIDINVDKINSKFMLSKYPALMQIPQDWSSTTAIANQIEELITT